MINYLGNFSVTFSVYNPLEKAERFFKISCFSIRNRAKPSYSGPLSGKEEYP